MRWLANLARGRVFRPKTRKYSLEGEYSFREGPVRRAPLQPPPEKAARLELLPVSQGMLQLELDAHAWTYLGEGNQNVVLQYAGSDARFCGRVLRLRKTTLDTQSADDGVRTCYEFLRNAMGPVLGDDVVNVGTLVLLPAGFAAAVSDAIRPSRPAGRAAKSLDERCSLGWLLPDLTLLESAVPALRRVYVVEVKPKCGFVPSSTYARQIYA
jgi:hypothetical protein